MLDGLRAGRFFVTTGEVLITEFTVNGQPSGSRMVLEARTTAAVEVRFRLSWTFPLRYVGISMLRLDGTQVFRDRIDLSDTTTRHSEERSLTHKLDLTGRTWIRLEAWDVAINGAFTQPVWLSASR